jgi:hypothetical protein
MTHFIQNATAAIVVLASGLVTLSMFGAVMAGVLGA